MKLNVILVGLLFLLLIGIVSGVEYSNVDSDSIIVDYFYGDGCSHCANVAESGVLERVKEIEGVQLRKLNVRSDGTELYNSYREELEIPAGWPLVVLSYNGESSYLRGDVDIIENLEKGIEEKGFSVLDEISWIDKISNYLEGKFSESLNHETGQLNLSGWGVLVVSAFVDSINPCAFGVLIFLMLSLLKMGSSKRALKAGLTYTFVVFVVYFSAGFGIFSVIQSFTSITKIIYISAGIMVLVLGLWQFKDVVFPGFGPSLQISPKAKPLIENIIQKGTIPANGPHINARNKSF